MPALPGYLRFRRFESAALNPDRLKLRLFSFFFVNGRSLHSQSLCLCNAVSCGFHASGAHQIQLFPGSFDIGPESRVGVHAGDDTGSNDESGIHIALPMRARR